MTSDGKILSHPEVGFVNKNVQDLLGSTPVFTTELNEINSESIVSFIPISGIDSVDWYFWSNRQWGSITVTSVTGELM